METVPFREDPETGASIPAGVEGYPIPGRRPANAPRRVMAAAVVAAIDEQRWGDMFDAALDLYALEMPHTAAPAARDAFGALHRIERRLRHGIYTTAVGDGAAVIMCDCGWTIEAASLDAARVGHRNHVDVTA